MSTKYRAIKIIAPNKVALMRILNTNPLNISIQPHFFPLDAKITSISSRTYFPVNILLRSSTFIMASSW